MTDLPMRRRVISQLASYSPKNPPTEARLREQMVPPNDRKEIAAELRQLKALGLAFEDAQKRWALTDAGIEAWREAHRE